MNELSLHILDICQNSIIADARIIKIVIEENTILNEYKIIISDNGKGMSEETLNNATDPFFTTRTTRKIGLGISLFKMAAEMTDGSFSIESEENVGTTTTAVFSHNHIDRAPLGDIEETLAILILNQKGIDINYEHIFNTHVYSLDTREIREELGNIALSEPSVIEWIKENIQNGIKDIKQKKD